MNLNDNDDKMKKNSSRNRFEKFWNELKDNDDKVKKKMMIDSVDS